MEAGQCRTGSTCKVMQEDGSSRSMQEDGMTKQQVNAGRGCKVMQDRVEAGEWDERRVQNKPWNESRCKPWKQANGMKGST